MKTDETVKNINRVDSDVTDHLIEDDLIEGRATMKHITNNLMEFENKRSFSPTEVGQQPNSLKAQGSDPVSSSYKKLIEQRQKSSIDSLILQNDEDLKRFEQIISSDHTSKEYLQRRMTE